MIVRLFEIFPTLVSPAVQPHRRVMEPAVILENIKLQNCIEVKSRIVRNYFQVRAVISEKNLTLRFLRIVRQL